MTDETMNLKTLVEKTPDTDPLRQMISFAAERLMEMEVAGLTGAGYGEKSAERNPIRTLRFPKQAKGRISSAFRMKISNLLLGANCDGI